MVRAPGRFYLWRFLSEFRYVDDDRAKRYRFFRTIYCLPDPSQIIYIVLYIHRHELTKVPQGGVTFS